MTLVYGCAVDDIGFIVGDTLLSSEFELKDHRGPINGKFHALKVQILDGDTAIAFAGDVATSLDLIEKIGVELRADPEIAVPERLSELYKDVRDDAATTPPDCDFLVLRLTSEGKKLAKVTKDSVTYCERAYIGDATEYKKMIGLREPYNAPS